MRNVLGNALTVTLFGESHGPYVGAVLDGIAPGIPVDASEIAHALDLRRPAGEISTARAETDKFVIVSGVFDGHTTGAPLTLLIPNENTVSCDYEEMTHLARPGHADYTGFVKYHGYGDVRGGGHFSGRVSAALVAVGAVVARALQNKGIVIGTHLCRCAGISDRPFAYTEKEIAYLNSTAFPVLDNEAAEEMKRAILDASRDGDSVGGVLETAVLGVPAGVGEPWFDSMEGMLSRALFGIGGIKGVSFGDGYRMCEARGSEVNDAFRVENGKVVTATNHAGGINGGITNGMPIVFSVAVKPTSSIAKEQETVDFRKNENAVISTGGRHDPCIAHRVRSVVDAVTALVVADAVTLRFGTDYLK